MVTALAGSMELRHLQATARMGVSSEFELFEPPPVQVEDHSPMAGWVGHDRGTSFYAVARLCLAERKPSALGFCGPLQIVPIPKRRHVTSHVRRRLWGPMIQSV